MSIRKLGLGGFAAVLWVLLLGVLVAPALAAAPGKPLTGAATGVTATTAMLNGEPAPLGATVGYYFSYNTNGTCEPGGFTEPVGEAPIAAAAKVTPPVEVTGLEPNKTYSYCLNATNQEGTTPGNIEPFKTHPAKPSVDSQSASGVTSTAATLEAQVNPNNEPTTSIVFEYGTSKTLAGAKTLKDETPLEGYGDQTATVPRLESLPASTTYYYRVIAKNATGTETGTVKSFTTIPAPTTEAPSAIGASTATFHGKLAPLNLNTATQYHFDYGVGTECSGLETPSEEAGKGSGTFPVPATSVTELQPNQNYAVCLVSSNEFGSETATPPIPFKTLPAPPGLGGESSSEVSSTSAVLSAGVNPNNQVTTYVFEYGVGVSGTIPAAIPAPVTVDGAGSLEGFGEQGASVKTLVLQPRTTYDYRIVATNAKAEKGEGPIEQFTTLAAPLVTSGEASDVTRTTAVLSGSVNPGGSATTYHFAYVPVSGYEPGNANPYAGGRSTPESESVGSDYAAHETGPVALEELAPGTTYDYALVASNSEGSRVGSNGTFTTLPPTAPLAVTGAASGVSEFAATLTGTVDTRGLPTSVQFEFGTAPGGGAFQAAAVLAGSEVGTSEAVEASLGSVLQPGTTYYYRVLASNEDGTTPGAVQSFTTPGFPAALTLPATPASIPFSSIAELNAKEARESGPAAVTPVTKTLTNAQKLAKELKACRKDRSKAKRAGCEKQARKRYAPLKKLGSK